MSVNATITPRSAQAEIDQSNDEILLSKDVAALLKCSPRHVNDMAKAGDILCRRVRRKTWFRPRRILDWTVSGSRRDECDNGQQGQQSVAPSGKGEDA